MNEQNLLATKKAYLSKTIIINSIIGLSMALVPFIPAMASVKTFVESNAIMIGTGWSVLNIVLRAISKDKIVLTD
jgi:hypothetical protein